MLSARQLKMIKEAEIYMANLVKIIWTNLIFSDKYESYV